MPEQSRTNPPDVCLSGVFESDPHRPPPVPAGSRAVETRDVTGKVIGWGWSAPDYAEALPDSALVFFDSITRASSIRLLK